MIVFLQETKKARRKKHGSDKFGKRLVYLLLVHVEMFLPSIWVLILVSPLYNDLVINFCGFSLSATAITC